MIPLHPLKKYRPTRIRDGVGGFTEVYGTATTIYGVVRVHSAETQLIFMIDTDVKPGDIVAVKED